MSKHLVVAAALLICVPASAQTPASLAPQVYRLQPGAGLQYRIQELLVKAVPGDVIEFSEGTFELTRQIDLVTSNITLRGQGANKTILSFKGQLSGGQGIEATGNNLVIERLAVEDTAGNAVKVMGARNVTFRHLRVEWTGEAKSSNGAYGLYPVQCSNVLIDSCTVKGASDAGIYVGQSRRAIVRGCRVERNVAGIEIENTIDADVHDNVATNNTGGLLVFDLPGLQVKAGRNVRVHRNRVIANNHRNFAAPGNIVAQVAPGTGLMIMATDQVEVFDNEIRDNMTASIAIVSYLMSGIKLQDKSYDPYNKSISIHDNRISGGGQRPSGPPQEMLVAALGVPLPDILFDGAVNPQLLVQGRIPPGKGLSIVDNGDATFADFKLLEFTPEALKKGTYKPARDLSPYAKPHRSLDAIQLAPHDPPPATVDKAVLAYRTAPQHLSEYGLFKGNGSTQEPADGVIPYDLNTTLFSDHTSKYRFIKLPQGEPIRYQRQGVMEFPEGTLISKTFAYPRDRSEPAKGERLLETRIELLRDGEWFGYSYVWNEQQTEATLLLGGGVQEVSWVHDGGETIKHRYEIPNANQCLNCHSQNKTFVPIGPTAANMNRANKFATGTANQLTHYASKALLDGLPSHDAVERMPSAFDPATGTLAQRARAWLHVNCAHCHSPQGTARTSGLDLRLEQSDPLKFGVWKAPVAAGHGSGGRKYDIVPGEPDKSILLFRLESNDPGIRMPSVARSLVPHQAVALIREWIAEMPRRE